MGSSDPGTLIHNAPPMQLLLPTNGESFVETWLLEWIGWQQAAGGWEEKTSAARRARGKTPGDPYKTHRGIKTSPVEHENSKFETQV